LTITVEINCQFSILTCTRIFLDPLLVNWSAWPNLSSHYTYRCVLASAWQSVMAAKHDCRRSFLVRGRGIGGVPWWMKSHCVVEGDESTDWSASDWLCKLTSLSTSATTKHQQ